MLCLTTNTTLLNKLFYFSFHVQPLIMCSYPLICFLYPKMTHFRTVMAQAHDMRSFCNHNLNLLQYKQPFASFINSCPSFHDNTSACQLPVLGLYIVLYLYS